MTKRPTYEELKIKVEELEKEVSRRQRAENALRESDERFRTLLQNSSEIQVILDKDGVERFVSEAAEAITGYAPHDLIGKSGFDFIHPDDQEALSKKFMTLKERKPSFVHAEFRHRTKGGSWVNLEAVGTNLLDDPAIHGIVLNIRDITEQKRAENALRESEEKYRSIIENMQDVFYRSDLKGRLILASPSGVRLLGYQSLEEVLGREIKSLYADPEDRDRFLQAIKENGGRITNYEIVLKRKDGSQVPVLTSSTYYRDHEGNVAGLEGIFIDITERRRAEEALMESESRLKSTFHAAPMGLAIVKDRGFVALNEAHCDIVGYREDELIGKTARMLYPTEEEFERAGNALYTQLWEQGITSTETHHVRKDGEVRRVFLRASPINRDDPSRGAVVAIDDITERRRAEKALRESEEKYKNILNNAQVGIFRTRISDSKLLECNDRFAEMLGFKDREECLASCLFSEHYVDAESRGRILEQLREKGEVNDIEIRFYKTDGSVVWLRGSARILLEAGYIDGVAYDITHEKATLEALADSEERYRSIIENIQEGYYEVDIAGNLKFFNESLVRILGYTRQELSGMNSRAFTNETNAKKLYQVFNRVYQEGKPSKGFDWEIIRKDGTVRMVEASVALIKDAEGHRTGFRGIVRDVTEEKSMEIQLQRAEKMETVGALAGGVAHDLNNILSGLVSYPELLLLQLPENSPLRKPITTIQQSGQKAVAVVQDLLTLARRAVVVREPLNLNDVILQYLSSPEYEKVNEFHPGIETVTSLEKGLLNMMGSSTHLSKTVMNLISNAAEAMPLGGRIIISTRNHYIDSPVRGYDDIREGDYVTLTVSDSGTGISSEDIGKIFEPFYTKKRMGRSGTGLGMAVVWGTVKDHQGYIDVRSDEGKGATFTLFFPATRRTLTGNAPKTVIAEYTGKGESILVIDDIKEQREVAVEMLRQLGYSADSVSSGEEAVRYLQTHAVDLILLDMIMDPGMDGLDTYKKIVETHPRQRAIIASGFSETDRVREAQRLGVGAYIRKPFLLETLGLAVREELRK